MPLLLILSVAAACLPLPWPSPPLDLGPVGSLSLTAAVTSLPVILAAFLSGWVVRTVGREPSRRSSVLARYSRMRRGLALVNLVVAAVAVVALGWGHTVWHALPVAASDGHAVLAPTAELLVPTPYFLALFVGWAVHFPAERALARGGRSNTEFWSLPGYLLFQVRQFALIVGLPIGLFVTQQSIVRVLPGLAVEGWFQAVAVVGMLFVFVLLPLAVKPVLGLRRLPDGPVRDQLEMTARRVGFRFTDLLLWPTRGAVANAMVVGVVPWARYVVFTDRLLENLSPAELDAVFGHEAGHAVHGHIPYYAAFLVVSSVVGAAVAVAVEQTLDTIGLTVPATEAGWLTLPPVIGLGVYLFVVFGLLSRRCERQADVFGCRTGSCRDPRCVGHDATTELVPGGHGLCRTGVAALVRALDRVSDLNGMGGHGQRGWAGRLGAKLRAWQHGPIPDRIEFLLRMADDPTLGDRADRAAAMFRVVLMVVLVTAFAVLGWIVGWDDLWRRM